MIDRMRSTYREYPRNFWVLVGASFIDTIGRTAMIPFFALYVTDRFDVGMTEAGILFAIFSIAGFFGNMIGGNALQIGLREGFLSYRMLSFRKGT